MTQFQIDRRMGTAVLTALACGLARISSVFPYWLSIVKKGTTSSGGWSSFLSLLFVVCEVSLIMLSFLVARRNSFFERQCKEVLSTYLQKYEVREAKRNKLQRHSIENR
mmetsp:Transcript_12965/g.19649  ORF Transcript_12965/g.19649 Transcript_12965/m.19649 type:complete len:109 (+) Transcript_12965:79-405(+)